MNLHAAADRQESASAAQGPITWQAGFAALGPAFYTELRPTPLPEPHWVATSGETAALLGLDPQWMASDEALQALTGNALLPGSQPLASVYSGHQFGVWAGQLGDGRAILLGETASSQTRTARSFSHVNSMIQHRIDQAPPLSRGDSNRSLA
jgi:uncharacterized protein YdiU (UPF0061 family)